MNIDLKGKTILVTGASSGIGMEIAKQLAQANATVAVQYNQRSNEAENLVKKLGNNSQHFKADLSSEEQCIKLYEDIIAAYGKIDMLVNNAGVFIHSPIKSDTRQWLDTWNKTQKVNLTAAAILSKLCISSFMDNAGGIIVFISSRAAGRGETEDFLAYAASKGGMDSLSRSIARSFGKYNIRSFTIAPGFVRTNMSDKYINVLGEDNLVSELALNRLTEPEDIAPLVVLMASGRLDHATGTTIDINGGSYIR